MSNEELFKQALVEGVSRHFDKIIEQEKQIEEMAKVIDYTFVMANGVGATRPSPRMIAMDLYDAGYRKQSDNVIELPCKVGQIVYMPWEWKNTSGIAILTVERMSITEAGKSLRTDLWSDDEDYWLAYNCGVFYFDDIGKTVFLTKEEAEQALAKMKGGE